MSVHWSGYEDSVLIELRAVGVPRAEIGRRLGRTEHSIKRRWQRLHPPAPRKLTLVPPAPKPKRNIRVIMQCVARAFDVTTDALTGRSQRARICEARFVAMLLAREMTGRSYPSIGLYIGGRDHTSILNGARRAREMMAESPELHARVGLIRQAVIEADAVRVVPDVSWLVRPADLMGV